MVDQTCDAVTQWYLSTLPAAKARTCAVCGKEYLRHNVFSLVCSAECKRLYVFTTRPCRENIRGQKRGKTQQLVCACCGHTFVAPLLSTGRRKNCPACRKAHPRNSLPYFARKFQKLQAAGQLTIS